jgi:hypothetical protein
MEPPIKIRHGIETHPLWYRNNTTGVDVFVCDINEEELFRLRADIAKASTKEQFNNPIRSGYYLKDEDSEYHITTDARFEDIDGLWFHNMMSCLAGIIRLKKQHNDK